MALTTANTIELDDIFVTSSEFQNKIFDFVWKLENFSGFKEEIVSPIFVDLDSGSEWRVKLRNVGEILHIALLLVRVGIFDPVKTDYQISFLNADGKIVITLGLNPAVALTDGDNKFHRTAHAISTITDPAHGYVTVDRTLRIHCRISTTVVQHDENKFKDKEYENGDVELVNKQFGSFLINEEYADVILKSPKDSFPCAKIFLAAHSPVFRAMFNTDMLESKKNTVKIDDFSDETIKGMLEFIYTGQTESLKTHSAELLKIGEKYQIIGLKNQAVKTLMEELNVENAADMLILASFHNSPVLKAQVVEFVKRCRKQVTSTASFKVLKDSYPKILLDLYTELD